ncbi:MAG: RNA 2',3'-cyclic phosphodiesterase [Nitrospira sp.]|nr:RNA 2',3'-cyclic phosphodiesterase [Nitrospira sp.]
MIRAFLAIELSEDLRAALAILQHDVKRQFDSTIDRQARIRWVQPDSMHLTLKFLGDMPDESIEPLRAAIEPVGLAHQPLRLPLERLGAFPCLQQPRVFWVGPSESWEQGHEAQRLMALHRAVEDCCQAAGFVPEGRPMNPHLTLARIKEGERRVAQVLAQSGMADNRLASHPGHRFDAERAAIHRVRVP